MKFPRCYKVFVFSGFTDIDHNTLVSVLQRDTLGLTESSIFIAIVR